MTVKKRLGRGLGSLIRGGVSAASRSGSPTEAAPKDEGQEIEGEENSNADDRSERVNLASHNFAEISIEEIKTNPFQPRSEIEVESIKELAESIRSEGLLQPVVVRRDGDQFELIAGERRFRACRELKLRTITARIIEASDVSSATMSLIENLQREGLNPIEEALGYASLLRDFDLTQEAVAERVGKGRATVANMLRLLQLEKEIQGFLGKNLLSVGHAKVLLAIDDSNQRIVIARNIIEKGLSVRDLERVVNRFQEVKKPHMARPRPEAESTAIRALEDKLASHLNTRVQIRHRPRKGKIVIDYYGNDDLQRILETLDIQH